MPLSAQQLNAAAQALSAQTEATVRHAATTPPSAGAAPTDTEDQAGLVSQILAQAPSQTIASALLVGSSGESNQNPLSASPGALDSSGQYTGVGGYGAFGFTSSEYTSPGGAHYVPPGAPPSAQVAAILPSYLSAASQVPPNLTGAAQAEWIAIDAEAPLGESTELAAISSSGGTTTYGANTSFNAQGAYLQAQQEESLGGLPGGYTGSGSSGSGTSSSASTGSGGAGAPASNSSLYKALQSVNGWLNPLGTSGNSNPAGTPGWLSDVINALTFGTSGLASAAASSSKIASGPLGWLQVLEAPVKLVLVRGAFALPGIIVLLAAAGITVLGIGSSGPTKNVLEVVDLAKLAGTKASSIGSKKG